MGVSPHIFYHYLDVIHPNGQLSPLNIKLTKSPIDNRRKICYNRNVETEGKPNKPERKLKTMASKAALETALRTQIMNDIMQFLRDKYETDVMLTDSSEFTMPALDSESNEKFVKIKVSIARGTRNENHTYDAYDGYAAADEYKDAVETKAHEKEIKKKNAEQRAKNKRKKSTTETEVSAS